jgi:uncharacterized membrane protein
MNDELDDFDDLEDLKIIKRTVPTVSSMVHIPLLSEVCLTLTSIVIVLAAAGVAIAALLAKAPIIVILMRTGITIFVVGLIGYFINWLIGRYLVNATIEKFQEELASRSAEDMETEA